LGNHRQPLCPCASPSSRTPRTVSSQRKTLKHEQRIQCEEPHFQPVKLGACARTADTNSTHLGSMSDTFQLQTTGPVVAFPDALTPDAKTIITYDQNLARGVCRSRLGGLGFLLLALPHSRPRNELFRSQQVIQGFELSPRQQCCFPHCISLVQPQGRGRQSPGESVGLDRSPCDITPRRTGPATPYL
jgi:hypothetical protein